VAPEPAVPLGENAWAAYKRDERARLAKLDAAARAEASRDEAAYWERRHRIARQEIAKREPVQLPDAAESNGNELTLVDRLLLEQQKDIGRDFAPLVNDYAFLRRLSLDTVGVIPTPGEIDEFVRDRSSNRRTGRTCWPRTLASSSRS
jgi:hypothetical protein